VRLGVFYDLPYRSDGRTFSADLPIVRFITSLPPRVEEVVLFGRLNPSPGTGIYALPAEHVRLVPLPFYPSIFDIRRLVAAFPGSCRRFSAELENVDAVWLFGPNPLAILFALIALARRKQVFLGVRQDYPEYIGARLPSERWRWALPLANLMEHAFRLISRRAPTTVEGEQIARNYRVGRAPVLSTGLSLISENELVPLDTALARPWDGEIKLVTVGRIDPEKNPLLLLDIAEGLRSRDPRWKLAVRSRSAASATRSSCSVTCRTGSRSGTSTDRATAFCTSRSPRAIRRSSSRRRLPGSRSSRPTSAVSRLRSTTAPAACSSRPATPLRRSVRSNGWPWMPACASS
jgi:hypothetical protein